MRLGLLGDIHGNACALRAVLASATSLGVEKLLVTGDLVGYYFSSGEVLELLRPWDLHVVRGNHEDMLQAARNDNDFLAQVDARYGSGLRTALDQLKESELDALCALPHPMPLEIDGCRILLCHGSPWDVDFYVYPDAEPGLLERCAMQEFELVVQGHTHYPMQQKIGKTLLVNPGSVGQPRNRQPGAQWALFDTETREVSLRCEAYDASPVIAESRRRHPEIPYLAEVLERT